MKPLVLLCSVVGLLGIPAPAKAESAQEVFDKLRKKMIPGIQIIPQISYKEAPSAPLTVQAFGPTCLRIQNKRLFSSLHYISDDGKKFLNAEDLEEDIKKVIADRTAKNKTAAEPQSTKPADVANDVQTYMPGWVPGNLTPEDVYTFLQTGAPLPRQVSNLTLMPSAQDAQVILSFQRPDGRKETLWVYTKTGFVSKAEIKNKQGQTDWIAENSGLKSTSIKGHVFTSPVTSKIHISFDGGRNMTIDWEAPKALAGSGQCTTWIKDAKAAAIKSFLAGNS